MTQFVECRECHVVYDCDDEQHAGSATCACGSTAVDPVPAKRACQTCTGNGVLYMISGATLDSVALDWVRCPTCKGTGLEA